MVENRDLAAVFMVLVVAWTMAGFALGDIQRARSGLVQAYVFAFAIATLALLPLVRSPAAWTALATVVVGAGTFVVVGLVGIATAPDTMVLFADTVTTALSAAFTSFAFRAYWATRSE